MTGSSRWTTSPSWGTSSWRSTPAVIEEIVATLTPEHLATLVYTSGTTGRPKGVELTHAAWTYEGAAVDALNLLRSDLLQFLWLPLSHVFGKVLLSAQWQLGFATAVDGRVDRIVDNLGIIQPTFMAAAPRIFEKVYTRIVSTTEAEGGAKAKIFSWAFGVGLDVVHRKAEGKSIPPHLKAQHAVADKLVFSKIRHRLGGRIEYFVSGSAALSPDIANWFLAAGLIILEGYGLTETSAGSCVNLPDDFKIGTVGRPLPGTEIRIAEDGEILIKGPGVMRGYHHQAEQTAEVLLDDGWFATGDVGEIDDDGRLRITDRKKDLVKTSNGKYIAPSAIESSFKALVPDRQPDDRPGRGTQLCHRARHPRPRRADHLGQRAEPGRLGPGGAGHRIRCPHPRRGGHQGAQRTAQPLGDHQGLPRAPA